MSGGIRSRRPRAATAISLVALFVALGSGAYAATHIGTHSIGAKKLKTGAVDTRVLKNGGVQGHDIAKNAVKGTAIADGSVTPSKLGIINNASVPASVSTTSNTPVDLGGPSNTVTVSTGQVIEIFAQVDMDSVGGGGGAAAQVDLVEPTLIPSGQEVLKTSANSFETRRTAPGTNDSDGVALISRGGWLTLAPPPGTYTFSLRYSAPGGGTATFQNRSLLVRVTR
jgi:hypothetical protein